MSDFINLTTEESWSCISPFVMVDENFEALSKPLKLRIFKQAIKKFITLEGNVRTEKKVAEGYGSKWAGRDTIGSIAEGGKVCVNWNASQFVVGGIGIRKLHTLRMMRLIEELKPRSVLDVGCGNGERLLILSCRFPDIEFTGLELTQEGVDMAKSVQKLDKLPTSLVNYSPEPLLDLSAHKSAAFICASAKEIPYEADTFDMVYTSLALEQMEKIRKEVLKEIYRVTASHASFYEAFHDFNQGLVQKSYVYVEDFFKGNLTELKDLGFKTTHVMEGLPQKIYMNNVHVLAKK